MKFLLFEEGAVDELVSNRSFQTLDFELGQAFLGLVTGTVKTAKLPPELRCVELSGGLAFVKEGFSKRTHYLVIDIEQSRLFEHLSDAKGLFVLQKLLRFSKKMWQGLSCNFSEKVISQSTKAVLFPFSYEPRPYRVVIERMPMKERLEKRDLGGRFLLAYKTGREQGDPHHEVAEETNFRKVIDNINLLFEKTRSIEKEDQEENGKADQIRVSRIEGQGGFDKSSIYRSYDDWQNLLTLTQKKFIESQIDCAQRIEGAAGTGKTLCLMLKAIKSLRQAETQGSTCHIVFLTHSEATKRAVGEFLSVIDERGYSSRDRQLEAVSLKVCTLSELCAEQLTQQISEAEFIDRDALESKETQLLYIHDALDEALNHHYGSHERFLSEQFKEFLDKTECWTIAEMLQHEISVIIKGRASENLDVYKKIPPLKYGLPLNCSADKGFVFTAFRIYQDKLGQAAQFDTDDVVLTTIGQLNTPIWRRRRQRDGYDAVFVDETHLFNINELHVFHHFTRKEGPYPIIYSIDRSQAVGDHGWTTEDIDDALSDGAKSIDGTTSSRFRTVFRSSPQIVDLAFSVVSAGATLFTNFDNPLEATASSFTDEDERLAGNPVFLSFATEQDMIEGALSRAEALHKELSCRRGEILVVGFERGLVDQLTEVAVQKNKPHILLKKRGDVEAVREAAQDGRFVFGHADYVGGLEFNAVVIVGADKGRLPPSNVIQEQDSRNFLTYASHNRLYVAISRARYRVEVLGERSRGPSELLKPALESGLLEETNG